MFWWVYGDAIKYLHAVLLEKKRRLSIINFTTEPDKEVRIKLLDKTNILLNDGNLIICGTFLKFIRREYFKI